MTVSTSGSTTPATTEQAGPRASAAGPAEPAAGGLPGTGKVPAEPAEPAEPSEPAEPTASTGAAAGRATGAEGGRPVLSIDGLAVAYPGRGVRGGTVPVLSGVGLDVTAGQILGVIGETGSGKTTLARAVVGAAPVTAGRITVAGVGVGALRGRALREHRRSGRVQYMFQDPLRSLDPDLTVTDLVGEPLAVAGVERGSGGPAPPRRCTGWDSTRERSATGFRPSSPAASASGSRWPGPSSPVPRCCSPTNR